MKKAFVTLLTAVSLMLAAGCTIQVDGMGNQTNPSSDNQENANQKHVQIQADIDKMYEDGIDFKVQLSGVKTAKGTWTVKYYDGVQVLKNKGVFTIASYNFGDLGGTDKPNNENDVNLYVSFVGIADGQKVTLDKVYVVTKEEFNQTPVEGDGAGTESEPPVSEMNLTWDELKTNIEIGFLFDPKVFLGAAKEEIIQALGEPDDSEYDDLLYYKNQNLTVGLDKNQLVDYIDQGQPKQLPQNIEEITKAFGEPYHSEGAAGKTYDEYKVGNYYVTIAWSNVESHVSEIRLSTQKPF